MIECLFPGCSLPEKSRKIFCESHLKQWEDDGSPFDIKSWTAKFIGRIEREECPQKEEPLHRIAAALESLPRIAAALDAIAQALIK